MLLRRGAALAKFGGWSYKFRRELLLLTPKPTRQFTSDARARSVAWKPILHISSISSPFLRPSLEVFQKKWQRTRTPLKKYLGSGYWKSDLLHSQSRYLAKSYPKTYRKSSTSRTNGGISYMMA